MAKPQLTPAQQKQILFGLGGLIFLVVWVNFFALPQGRKWSEDHARLQSLRGEAAQLKQRLAQMPQMEAEIQRLSSQAGLPISSLPPEEQLPELLKAITETARKTQVRLVGAKPKADVNKLTPGSSGYLELPVFIGVSGGYHQMGVFLDTLESSPNLLLRVREFGIMGDAEDLFHAKAFFLLQAYLVPNTVKPKEGGA